MAPVQISGSAPGPHRSTEKTLLSAPIPSGALHFGQNVRFSKQSNFNSFHNCSKATNSKLVRLAKALSAPAVQAKDDARDDQSWGHCVLSCGDGLAIRRAYFLE